MKRLGPWLSGILAAMALSTVAGGLSGCKQDVGEVCQIDTDCKDGLICNQATKLCEQYQDAAPRPDATPTPDAAPTPDSGPDAAAADAGPDAAPTADAAPADAN